MSGQRVSDTQTGLRAFSGDLIAFMKSIPGERYEYEMNCLMGCAKEKINFMEVPIHTICHDETNSCSHFRKGRDSIRIYKDIIKFGLSSFFDYILLITGIMVNSLIASKVQRQA